MVKYDLINRIESTDNVLLKKLYKIMLDKQTNLCLAADFYTLKETVEFIHEVGPHLCILKTHCYYYRDCTDPKESLKILSDLKQQYNFLLFEDMKLCDGKEQIKTAYLNWFIDYVDLVTVRPIDGPGVFQAIREAIAEKGGNLVRGCLSVIQVSFQGVVVDEPEKLHAISLENSDVCVGFIAQDYATDNRFVKLSPGVHIEKKNDSGNQSWRHPDQVMSKGADILIVGRGITQAPINQRLTTLLEYKNQGFKKYSSVSSI